MIKVLEIYKQKILQERSNAIIYIKKNFPTHFILSYLFFSFFVLSTSFNKYKIIILLLYSTSFWKKGACLLFSCSKIFSVYFKRIWELFCITTSVYYININISFASCIVFHFAIISHIFTIHIMFRFQDAFLYSFKISNRKIDSEVSI